MAFKELIEGYISKQPGYLSSMVDVKVEEMAQSTLGYKEIQDAPIAIERIEKLENDLFLTIVVSSVDKKPYFTTSFFKLQNEKIIELVEYYGDF